MPSYKNNRCYEAEEVTLIPGLNEIDQVQCPAHQQRALGWGHITDRSSPEQSVPNLSVLLLRTQDAERRRISRELHDSAGQNLAAIKLKLESARKKLSDRSEVGNELAECCDLVSECLKEIRTTSYLLHPPLLDELGLDVAVRSYVEGFAKRSRVDVNINIDGALGRLDHDIEMAFFRVIQEALTNIHRHSGSSIARITIGRGICETFVEIADSGKGMPDAMADPYGSVFGKIGVGIAGMRERMKELSGKLEIYSTSTGTTVRASVPRKTT